jgi:histidyl-tRNA synthetase
MIALSPRWVDTQTVRCPYTHQQRRERLEGLPISMAYATGSEEMTQKFQRPKGTRDFLPEGMALRRSVMDKIRAVFVAYGYGELDTPAFEYFVTLAQKSGPEVEKEIYCFEDKGGRKLGLVFEFTTSLARVVASNPSLPLPFKRYAIGKVWRYENPSSGRYREFYQADVDIVGPYSMDCEAELLLLTVSVLTSLGLAEYRIHLNNRKILEAQAHEAGIGTDKVADALRALDKLAKIGRGGVASEFIERGMILQDCDRFLALMATSGDNREKLDQTREMLRGNRKGLEGVDELDDILTMGKELGFGDRVYVDPYLVRGLDYYTGPIFEARATTGVGANSFAGGGRYDQLVGLYGGRPAGAVGISFGIERVVEILSKDKAASAPASKVLVTYISPDVKLQAMRLAEEVRQAHIPTEFALVGGRIAEQMRYANRRGIPYTIIVGPDEVGAGKYRLKTMQTGIERTLDLPEIVETLQ